MLMFPMLIFANSHITNPAGAAIAIALPNTNSVLSSIDLISICPICGFLYGGSSYINDVLSPFNIVLLKILDINNVITIPSNTINKTVIVDTSEGFEFANIPPMNILDMVIKNGNLPLHGTNAFVRIDISFSLGESIILQPVTPQLLQPKPIHIVSACLPRTSCLFEKFI